MSKSTESSLEKVSDADKQQRYKKRVFTVFALLLFLVAVGIFGWWWLFWRGIETTDDAFIDGDISHIAPQISGQVTAIDVRDNQYVEKGTTLVTLDSRAEQIALEKAQAAYQVTAAQYQQNQAEQAVVQALIEQARADIDVAQAQYQHAQREYLRYRDSGSAVSKSELDGKAAQAKISAAALLAREKSFNSSTAQLRKVQAALAEINATLQQNQAEIDRARLQLSYATIRAPVTGFVTKRTISVGNYVTSGRQMLTLISGQVWVTANFKENQLRHMRSGQSVEIQIDAFPGQIFHGKVDSVQRATGSIFSLLPAENATGSYVKIVQRIPVKITFTDEQITKYPLAPGMSVVPRVDVRP